MITNDTIDEQIMGKVIADALIAVNGNATIQTWEKKRWVNTIAKAKARMEENGWLITWYPESDSVLIWTVLASNKIYEANGTCSCEAFTRGQPCWHRATAKLLRNYYKAIETKEAAVKAPLSLDTTKMPYLKTSSTEKPEVVGGCRI